MQILQTPNISSYTTKKIGFILHGTLGKYNGAVNWLMTAPQDRPVLSYSSAHYVISKLGEVTQLAKNEQVTWHAGVVRNPTWRGRKYLPTKTGAPGTTYPQVQIGNKRIKESDFFGNPNDSFIGIELEWFVGDIVTEAQYGAIVNIIKSSGIKDPAVLSHSEITEGKGDFGRDAKGMLPVQEVLRRIK